MSSYLKEPSAYEDRYDLMTIEDCLSAVDSWRKRSVESGKTRELEKLSEEEKNKGFNFAINFTLLMIKGDRFRRRGSTLEEWMSRDRLRDQKLVGAAEPQKVACPNCSVRMNVISRDLYESFDEPLRVLFFLECPRCNKRRGVFDNGEYFVSRPEACPECRTDLQHSFVKQGNVEVWTKMCPACRYKSVESEDVAVKQKERESQAVKNNDLLQRYRSEFCWTEGEAAEYFETMRNLEAVADLLRKHQERIENPDYEKVKQLEKLGVIQLEKKLAEILQTKKYIHLVLEKPVIDREVIVPFTVQDAASGREPATSERQLKSVLSKVLQETNWRLMSEGVSYRLGYLSGRLKGYEKENDLLRLVKEKNRS
jgi:hypothetical protein